MKQRDRTLQARTGRQIFDEFQLMMYQPDIRRQFQEHLLEPMRKRVQDIF
ncbi:hypothetical protein [Tritonibacter scottomollicae]